VHELPFEGTQAVASGKSISEVVDDVEHSVLILGQPGSGKTTTLLTLVSELVARAEKQPALTIPVVLHLSSWVDPKKSLGTWLVDELNSKYQILKKIGKNWLAHQRLLLVDGLDEVKAEYRDICVEAVNQFGKETGLPGLVVCCRFEQYEELTAKLTLNGAICLRPITDPQIDTYVEEAGPELAGLRTVLQQDSVIKKLARSPLMINLMCLAYRDYEAANLTGRETPDDRSTHLFTTYIDEMFKKVGKAQLAYPRERTLSGVGMVLLLSPIGRNRGIVCSIETVESLRWTRRYALRGALLGLLGGLVVGYLAMQSIDLFKAENDKSWIFPVGFATVCLGLGALLGGLKPYVLEGKTLPNQGIKLSLKMALLTGLHAIWLIAIVMAFYLIFSPQRFGIETDFISSTDFFTITSHKSVLNTTLRLFFTMFTIIFLWFGGLDVIKHYVLRAVLTLSGQTPWNFTRFLEQARGLNLMQRIGSAYIFVHRRLLEHLAKKWDKPWLINVSRAQTLQTILILRICASNKGIRG
jgi:DNA polymerase III delta prime subunit